MEIADDSPQLAKKVEVFKSSDLETSLIPADFESNPGFTPPTPFSKNQLKKQRKLAKYEQVRKEKRRKERERQKEKRKVAAENGLPIRTGPSRKELKKKQQAAVDNENSLRIVIDLDCDNMMSERDVAKCVKQCLRIYTINRRSDKPVHLHFTGIKTGGNIHKCFKKNDGWENWQVEYHFDNNHVNVFKPSTQLVYLTSESDNVLENLEHKDVYCIGGLVDHNHHKSYCHDKAMRDGIRTARLPLGEYVDMKTRTVLTTFHVFEILIRVAEGKCWADAIMETIPPRKGAILKHKHSTNDFLNDKSEDKLKVVDVNEKNSENEIKKFGSNNSLEIIES